MYKLGISGGVGAGKSRVLSYIAEHWNAAVFQADILAHQLQLQGGECYEEICSCFGKEILSEDGTIDRTKLGSLVFGNEKEMKKLNKIVHPAVDKKIKELMKAEEDKGTEIFVLEAALLTEERYRNMLDEIWYIRVSEEMRAERLKTSRSYSEEKIKRIFSSQESEQVYRLKSDRVIENGGGFSETCRQLEDALKKMTEQSDRETGDKHS